MKNGFYIIILLCCSYLLFILFFSQASVWNYYKKKTNYFELEEKTNLIKNENQNINIINNKKKQLNQEILLELGYIKKNENIVDIIPPAINSKKKIFLDKNYILPISTIIFFSFIILLLILFLMIKYQKRLNS